MSAISGQSISACLHLIHPQGASFSRQDLDGVMYLMARGRDAEAVEVVEKVDGRGMEEVKVTEEVLKEVG